MRLNPSSHVKFVPIFHILIWMSVTIVLLSACLAAPPQSIAEPATQTAGQSSTPTSAGTLLESHISLGDGRTLWHPTRAQLGFRLAPGISTSASISQTKFTIEHGQLTAYLVKISPYVRRAPMNAHPVVLAQYAGKEMYVSTTSTSIPCKIVPECDGGSLC